MVYGKEVKMSNYETELIELNTWHFHCCRKAEKLSGFANGHGLSEREIAEHEIFVEYIKRLNILNNKYGIKKEVTESCFGQLTLLPPLEQILDRLVI